MKRGLSLIILVVFLVFVFTGCMNENDKKIEAALANDDLAGAVQLTMELYKDNKTKQDYWLGKIKTKVEAKIAELNALQAQKDALKPPLEIQDGWTWTKDGNYTYIEGRIKNVGTRNIKYFEVHAEYTDANKQVLDSDYTNSGETLRPGNMKEFKIMHEYDPAYQSVSIFASDVTYDN